MYNISPNTLFIGRKVHFIQECSSTNEIAYQLILKNKAMDGTVVLCQHQTAGKGQHGNSWQSDPGKNLTFSVILSPDFIRPDHQFKLNMMVSLALKITLDHFLVNEVDVKWPNDILASGKKICGVLIENSLQGNQIRKSVIGVGLNVNQEQFSIPHATSMMLDKGYGKSFNHEEVLTRFCESLEKIYLRLKSGNDALLEMEYVHALYGMNKPMQMEDENGVFEGIITGISPIGQLRVKRTSDEEKLYNFKEVRFLYGIEGS